jgi:UDP-glucose 4-epimerase
VHGAPLIVNEAPRRAGDPPSLVAHAGRVRDVLGWSPRFDDLEVIVRTQLEWEHRLLREPGLQRN